MLSFPDQDHRPAFVLFRSTLTGFSVTMGRGRVSGMLNQIASYLPLNP